MGCAAKRAVQDGLPCKMGWVARWAVLKDVQDICVRYMCKIGCAARWAVQDGLSKIYVQDGLHIAV